MAEPGCAAAKLGFRHIVLVSRKTVEPLPDHADRAFGKAVAAVHPNHLTSYPCGDFRSLFGFRACPYFCATASTVWK